jgi:hypothetical protein
MLLGVVLLYVGAVLAINGLWLLGQARAAAAERVGEPVGPEGGAVAATVSRPDPLRISNTEVAILNVFTGFVGVVAATTFAVQGNAAGEIGDIRASGFVLLFAFTYLWVAFNQWVPGTDGHAFGWYCLFVALTAVPAGIYTLDQADGNSASIYLAIDWFAWAVLWFMFFVLLALERPIGRITGAVALLEGIGTAWVFGFLLLEDVLAF